MDHRNLDAWNKSIMLVKKVYGLTDRMPGKENYGLTMQIRRAAISIPSNIAEGAARESDLEFIKFLYYSVGSTTELETQLIISEELEYLQITDEINEDIQQMKQVLLGLIRYLKSKRKTKS
jgi:four helix bundle protein